MAEIVAGADVTVTDWAEFVIPLIFIVIVRVPVVKILLEEKSPVRHLIVVEETDVTEHDVPSEKVIDIEFPSFNVGGKLEPVTVISVSPCGFNPVVGLTLEIDIGTSTVLEVDTSMIPFESLTTGVQVPDTAFELSVQII